MKKSFALLNAVSVLFSFLFLSSCGETPDFGVGDKSPAQGELQVLVASPKGDEIPIGADGVTVMFGEPMVPLATLDRMRDLAVPLEITPATPGKFTWLGTKGFIFRPASPFVPATPYTVKLPAGLASLNGFKLPGEVKWEFATVRPRLVATEPSANSMLLPKRALVKLRFNVAMNRDETLKALAFADAATNTPVAVNRRHTWEDGDHSLTVEFTERLPWDGKILMRLAAGIHGAKGTLGTREAAEIAFETPPGRAGVEKVFWAEGATEHVLSGLEEYEVPASTGICYRFSQAIFPKSFERALAIEPPAGKKANPYFYYSEYGYFYVGPNAGPDNYLNGYKVACAVFLDEPAALYGFRLDHALVETLTGAPIEGSGSRFAVRTPHAPALIVSNLTRPLLSAKGLRKIPYRGVNLARATFHIYPLEEASQYTESLRNGRIRNLVTEYDPVSRQHVPVVPFLSNELGGGLSLPVIGFPLAVDRTRMAPLVSVPFDVPPAAPDESSRFIFDLAGVNAGRDLNPGFYLIEATGEASFEGFTPPEPAYSVVQITPAALAVKRDADRLVVWATDIESGSPLANVPVTATLTLSDNDTALTVSGLTDELGVAVLEGGWSDDEYDYYEDACARITDPAIASYTCQGWHDLSPWRSVMRQGKNYYAYLYTDRPIYRPGQTLGYTVFVREVREGRYFVTDNELKVNVGARDASWQNFYTKEDVVPGPGGIITGSVLLPDGDDAPRGEYELSVKAAGQTFSRAFFVQSYRKPSFKVEMSPRTPEISAGDELKALVHGEYFFGAPLRGAKTSWAIMTATYAFSAEDYWGHSFIDDDLVYSRDGGDDYYTDYEYDTVASYASEEDDHWTDPRGGKANRPSYGLYREGDDNDVAGRKGGLDDAGELLIRYRPDLAKYPVSQVLTVEVAVKDAADQEVSAAAEVIVHRADFYLGVRPGKWVYGENEEAVFDIVSLDTKGKPSAGKNFTAKLLQRDYTYIQRRNARGYWEFLYEPKDTEIETFAGVTDAGARATIKAKLPGGGTFRLQLRGEDSRKNPVAAASTVYAWGKGYVPWKLNEAGTIELVPDKDSYRVGETARVLVKSLLPLTKALVAYERGRVLDYKVVELGGNAAHIDIPVIEGMIPNFSVDVIAHVGRDETHPPLLYHGETSLAVDPESKRLTVTLVPDRAPDGENPAVYRPGEEVAVRVRTTDPAGNPVKAHLAVSVADESVLTLLDYRLPDLVKAFYFERPNQVYSSSSMASLKSGDGATDKKKRRLFKDTAHYESDLVTGNDGEAVFRFKLPDDLTTWVIEAVAVSESKAATNFDAEARNIAASKNSGSASWGPALGLTDGTFVGAERAKIMTTLPVVLRAALPRFAAWDDRVEGKVVLVNRNAEAIEGSVLVVLNDAATFVPRARTAKLPFQLAPRAEGVLGFAFDVAKGATTLAFSATATDATGETRDAVELTIPVLDRFAPETVATSGVVTGEVASERLELPENLRRDIGGLAGSFKATMGLALAQPMQSLIYFPWGCSEQKSASLIALVLAHDLASRFGEKYLEAVNPLTAKEKAAAPDFAAKISALGAKAEDVIKELIGDYQFEDGSIGYWKDSENSDFLAGAQVAWAFTLAREHGFAVDEWAYRSLADSLVGDVRYLGESRKAYGVWALSQVGRDDEYTVSELLGDSERLSTADLSYLLIAAGRYEKTALLGPGAQALLRARDTLKDRLVAKALFDPRHVSWPSDLGTWWSSPVRNTALAGYALLETDKANPLVAKALPFLLNRRDKNREFVSTQEILPFAAFGHAYALAFAEAESDYTAVLSGNGKELFSTPFNRDNLLTVAPFNFPSEKLAELGETIELAVGKQGTGTLYYDFAFRYYLPPEASPPREEGLIVTREYYALKDKDNAVPLTEFTAGETYKGHITIVVARDMEYAVVEERLPAGFEPVDMTLATTGRAAAAQLGEDEGDDYGAEPVYDDEVPVSDYGSDYGFSHRELRDDAIVWSDTNLPPGVYHLRYPVRAAVAGRYLSPGARAFAFYEPEIFGRARPKVITVKPSE